MTLQIGWESEQTLFDGAGESATEIAFHVLEFDCVTSETHEGTSVLTEHAVESGAPVSDHKRANPDRVSIEAIVTNTPLDAPPPSGFASSNVTVRISKDGAQVKEFSEAFDRVQDVIDTLDRLRLESVPITLSTRWKTYENVQIVSVVRPRDSTDGDSSRFTVDLVSVRTAFARDIDAPLPREPRGNPRRDRGAREAEEVTDPELSSTANDLANQAVEAIGGLFGT